MDTTNDSPTLKIFGRGGATKKRRTGRGPIPHHKFAGKFRTSFPGRTGSKPASRKNHRYLHLRLSGPLEWGHSHPWTWSTQGRLRVATQIALFVTGFQSAVFPRFGNSNFQLKFVSYGEMICALVHPTPVPPLAFQSFLTEFCNLISIATVAQVFWQCHKTRNKNIGLLPCLVRFYAANHHFCSDFQRVISQGAVLEMFKQGFRLAHLNSVRQSILYACGVNGLSTQSSCYPRAD